MKIVDQLQWTEELWRNWNRAKQRFLVLRTLSSFSWFSSLIYTPNSRSLLRHQNRTDPTWPHHPTIDKRDLSHYGRIQENAYWKTENQERIKASYFWFKTTNGNTSNEIIHQLLLACFFRIIPSHMPRYLDALGPYFLLLPFSFVCSIWLVITSSALRRSAWRRSVELHSRRHVKCTMLPGVWWRTAGSLCSPLDGRLHSVDH